MMAIVGATLYTVSARQFLSNRDPIDRVIFIQSCCLYCVYKRMVLFSRPMTGPHACRCMLLDLIGSIGNRQKFGSRLPLLKMFHCLIGFCYSFSFCCSVIRNGIFQGSTAGCFTCICVFDTNRKFAMLDLVSSLCFLG